ncbi:MAG: ABC transporter substrate-binding protein, partial [Bacteroidota bacterium]
TNSKRESIPMDIEIIYKKASGADYWINTGTAKSREDLLAIDHRLALFNAYENLNIYNNNKRLNANGGNDFWESALLKPDFLLKDLISIFHPSLFPEHEFYYYKKIE